LTDFTFEFIRRPVSPILSPSSRTFVKLTLVRWEKSFQSPNERLQNIPKVTKCYEVKPRRTSRRYKQKSRVSSATYCKTFNIKGIHIRNDPVSPKVQKRAEEHIKTSELSNIITTGNYRILEVVGVLDTGVSRSTCSWAPSTAQLWPRGETTTEAQRRRPS
jgi:hypothetical protein